MIQRYPIQRRREVRYNDRALKSLTVVFGLAACLAAAPAHSQDAPPPIGLFSLDVHGTIPHFPDQAQLAESHGLKQGELPGTGLGLYTAATLYVLKWKAVTFGLGGQLTMARAHSGARPLSETETGRAVTERFRHASPQLSFNFGDGDGWSYISGGVGPATWSLIPDGESATATDEERLFTIDYGGGARWFIKRHLAFSFDVRFYAINPGTPGVHVGSPRTTLLIMGAGISLK
jgi:hypothetical protein